MSKLTLEQKAQRDREYVDSVRSAPIFGWKDKIGYMLGDLGGNSLQVLVNLYLLMFMTSIVKIEAAHFALIVGICKALDSLNDPIIGRITDTAKGTKNGKFGPFLKIVAIPMSLLTLALFMDTSSFPYIARVAYGFIVYFFWGVVSSFWNIPYGTMLNSITTNQEHRSELSNWRSIGSTGANVIVQTIAPLLIFNSMNEATAGGYVLISIILGVFSALCLFLTTKLTHERVIVSLETIPQKINYIKVIKSFLKNRPLIAIILAYIISKFFIQTTGTTNQYVFQVFFKDTKILAAVGMGTMVPMIIGMLLVRPLLKIFGKKNLITWPILLASMLYLYLAFGEVTPFLWISIQMVCSFLSGFFSLLIWSLIADGVDYQAYLTKERNDGTVYSVVTFVVFLVASLSTSFIAMLLDAVGFIPELQAQQIPEVAQNIKVLSGILPAIGCILIFACFFFIYNMKDEDMARISAEVSEESIKLANELE